MVEVESCALKKAQSYSWGLLYCYFKHPYPLTSGCDCGWCRRLVRTRLATAVTPLLMLSIGEFR